MPARPSHFRTSPFPACEFGRRLRSELASPAGVGVAVVVGVAVAVGSGVATVVSTGEGKGVGVEVSAGVASGVAATVSAGAVVADVWISAMLSLWGAGLWLLGLAFSVIDALATPDLSAGGTPVCAVSHGCTTVQQSDYAALAGVPVAVLGLLGYVAILFSLARDGEAWRRASAFL